MILTKCYAGKMLLGGGSVKIKVNLKREDELKKNEN